MGKKHRARRTALKVIVGEALKKGGINIPVKTALKLLKGGKTPSLDFPARPADMTRYWRRLQGEPEPDKGYKETELGELKSTIKKLTEHEIIDRMCARATFELHQQEDARVFAEIEAAISV
jgi:hypothetical protein